ncbi:MAG: hypothetical protein KAI80_08745 [Hyphomicrobiaceae bacterium]|nr:hypothetical protein [Hyphomicrobiaceae bacterium]
MSVYIIPAEDAAALNAHVASEYGQMLFAVEDEHGWTFDDSAFPAAFDFDAVIVACILGPDLAGYLADKPQLASRHCKIYRYLPEGEWDKLAPPMPVNYRTGLDRRLERKTTRVLGDVVSVEYFGSATFNPNGSKSFADRVLIEEYEWTRDPPGTLSRDITIRWDLEDGTTHAEAKTMTRMYSPDERMLAGEKRRKSIITDLKVYVGGVLVATQVSDVTDGAQIEAALDLGRDFIRDYSFQIANYEMASDQSLFAAIQSDTAHAWLDVPTNGGTVRDAVLAAINIWGLE